MGIQEKILKTYKINFPQDRLKEISKRTGINITRVFRILNGSIMKLNEYEKFCQIIHVGQTEEDSNTNHLYHENIFLVQEAFKKLSEQKISELTKTIRLYLKINKLKQIN